MATYSKKKEQTIIINCEKDLIKIPTT